MEKQHHIWCNTFHLPVDGCKFCKRLREDYPEKPDDPMGERLMADHFPNNVIVKRPD